MIIGTIVFTVFVLLLALLLLLGRPSGRLASGRAARLLRIGNLSARLYTSWVGAKIRRLFAGADAHKRLDAAQRKANAERIAETMGQMKGAFMKLGQMLSFVTDDIPEEYRDALASLQASAPPMDLALLRDVAESELGMPLERAFARFDSEPLASASIGQVHRAQLPTGEEVVVKIQYPGVAEAIGGDLSNVGVLYRMMAMFYPGVEPAPLIDELRGRIGEELDYRNEAKNQRAFYDLYENHPFVRIPRVFESHSTGRVLTSEYVAGRRYADICLLPDEDRQRYAEILYRFIFGSIARFGVFNGDPHPGNYLFDDNGHVVFLDFGCVKYFPQEMRRNWKALISAHLSGDRAAFKRQLLALRFIRAEDELDENSLYDYFNYFYEPFHFDRTFTFTREYNAKSFGMIFKPQGKFATLGKRFNMPPDFVFVNRIQWGVVSLLANLGASANWHRIHREFHYEAPPSTELGRIDIEWRKQWRAARNLDAAEFALTPDGIRRVA
jgi:predicted unusual protein kinase regulating ubiquinone biosynthesis (AarF/ABC1/UbiB family)